MDLEKPTNPSRSRGAKTWVLSAALVGVAGSALGQGLVYFNNGRPQNVSPTAPSGGAFFDGFSTPGSPALLNDASVYHGSLWGGGSPSALALLVSDALMDELLPGQLGDDIGGLYAVPGVPAASVGFFQLEIWRGDAPTLAAAIAAGEPWAISPVFQSVAGNSVIENGPTYLSGMPAVILTIPEPGVFALIALGTASFACSVGRQRRTPCQRRGGS